MLTVASNDTSVVLMIFPNSSTAALSSLNLLLISWIQSSFELIYQVKICGFLILITYLFEK